MGRVRGVFVRPEPDEKEPQRTERLLSRPIALFRSTPADAMDAMKLAWFQRANGRGFVGISYDFVALIAGLAIAALNGLGPNIDITSNHALMQVASIMTIQICTAFYVFTFKPSADRIDNMLTGTQFALEGAQTATLLYASVAQSRTGLDSSSALESLGFWLGLIAIFVPIVEKVYDAVVSQISACCRGEFDPVGFFYATLALALALPKLLGFDSDTSDTIDSVTDSVDEAASTAEVAADERLLHEASRNLMGGAGFLSDVASNLLWMRTSAPHNRAATRMQANWRGAHKRASLAREDEEAAIIVEKWRSRMTLHRQMMTKHHVAIMVQSAFRGARERRKVELEGNESKAQLVHLARARRVYQMEEMGRAESERQLSRRLILIQKQRKQFGVAVIPSAGQESRQRFQSVKFYDEVDPSSAPELPSRPGVLSRPEVLSRPGYDWLQRELMASGDSAPLVFAANKASARLKRAIRILPETYPPPFQRDTGTQLPLPPSQPVRPMNNASTEDSYRV